MLLALIVMATFTLGLLFSGWLTPTPGKAQQTMVDPTPTQETTNCVVAYTATACTEASVSFGASSAIVCGLPITVSVNLVTTNGQIITDTSYTNAGNSGSNACPDTFVTNTPSPTIISQTWADSSSGTSSTGLSASFTPAAQSGSVTFTVVWQHVCDANYATNTTSVSYSVPCPTITSSTFAGSAPSGYYGAVFDHDLSCQAGWWTWENVTEDFDSCGQNTNGFDQNGVAGQMNSGSLLEDAVGNVGTPGASCTSVTTQMTYFALVSGGSMANNNSVCSIVNTQTIVVTQTNNTLPAHGIIITTVTEGGGGTNISYY